MYRKPALPAGQSALSSPVLSLNWCENACKRAIHFTYSAPAATATTTTTTTIADIALCSALAPSPGSTQFRHSF